ncbi:MarR family transcriptional regulator [Actinacidiphila guanduensis]|jgi:DNA-binding MarR family transcriptional regulator|uniref:DNA-binding transcriptional regulator, MarR family n=1 Tax=Actinacidiphila guanduensis TaxID=310781 RepID=A0A1H0GLE6_9ACTN|nr:MarR family transcriptional regulator [Actinacidiphila guanduensis]SDO07708.1 DNA-binding transcriptional regulator, MarR family [Actinacidiphila guanduensis]
MDSTLSRTASTARRRRRLTNRIKEELRDLSMQMTLLNHQVGSHLDLRDADLECLDLISRYGPLGPTALARRAGLHPATLTGVLDRLERGGWVVRTPNPSDRRAILVQVIKEKEEEIAFLFSGLNHAMDTVCADYEDAELLMIADFLQRSAKAGRLATDELAGN